MMRRTAATCAVLLSCTCVSAVAAQDSIDVRRAVGADAYIRIWNGGGSVRVEGWASDSVAVTGRARDDQFFLMSEPGAAKLGIEGGNSVSGDLVVRVPRNATVWIRTGSADVTVRDFSGGLDVYSVTGSIDVEGRLAHFYAESIAGDLMLRIDSDVVRARSGDGTIAFTGTTDDLTLSTVRGGLDVHARGPRRAALSTVQGDIAFTGDLGTGGSMDVETHSGDVAVLLPPDTEAEFSLTTFEGRIESEFGSGAVRTANGEPRVTFATGAGGDIVVRTFSGSITLRKDARLVRRGS